VARDLQVLGFGSIAADDIICVDRPLKAGKGKVVRRLVDHGGNVGTAHVAVAKLGGRAGLIGWLRDDRLDDPSAREFERQSVDISFAPRRPDAMAVRSVIVVGSDGERFIAYDGGGPPGTSEALADETLIQACVLMIDGYAAHSVSVVARARRLGLAVVADIEWTIGGATDEVIALSDHLVLPVAFARTYAGETDVKSVVRALCSDIRAAVILTDGENGSYVRQKGEADLLRIPAWKVTAVDTTGAGDCFHGAYAFALTGGKAPVDAALFANAAAALSVTGHGGRAALPTLAACRSMLARQDAPTPITIGTLA
jgi:sugar/nucleoside kinase (ribokinase family)